MTRLVQFLDADDKRRVGKVGPDGKSLRLLKKTVRIYDLALIASRSEESITELAEADVGDEQVDYEQILNENRVLPPLDHPQPAYCIVTGTGLTHLGSAQSRNAMHEKLGGDPDALTDSMRIFKLGLEGGKPEPGQIGVSPEWFYKGDGRCIVPSGHPLELSAFAEDGGEEAELVGLYLVGDSGKVFRVGFSLGNEYSDHVLEKRNYLYLAHSKLRQCSMGPELLLGDLPAHIEGTVKVLRDGKPIWSDTFLTGEANMSHSLANMEHHHFKYALFRRPGDVHCHFFGAATLSFTAGVKTESGDVFEISAPPFSQPLRNTLVRTQGGNELVTVEPL